jgi:hypothetical protein
VPSIIYKTDGGKRGFVTAMLAPVNSKSEPKFGPRQIIWSVILAIGTVALMRLLLAH